MQKACPAVCFPGCEACGPDPSCDRRREAGQANQGANDV